MLELGKLIFIYRRGSGPPHRVIGGEDVRKKSRDTCIVGHTKNVDLYPNENGELAWKYLLYMHCRLSSGENTDKTIKRNTDKRQ